MSSMNIGVPFSAFPNFSPYGWYLPVENPRLLHTTVASLLPRPLCFVPYEHTDPHLPSIVTSRRPLFSFGPSTNRVLNCSTRPPHLFILFSMSSFSFSIPILSSSFFARFLTVQQDPRISSFYSVCLLFPFRFLFYPLHSSRGSYAYCPRFSGKIRRIIHWNLFALWIA